MICLLKKSNEALEYLSSLVYVSIDEIRPRYTWLIVSLEKPFYYPITTRYGNRIGLFNNYITCNTIDEFKKYNNIMN